MSTGINIVGQEKLVSGTNIKTINGESILGSGDITIGSSSPFNAFQYSIFSSSNVIIPTPGNVTIYVSEGEVIQISIHKTTINSLSINQYLTTRLNNTAVLVNIPTLSPQNFILTLTELTDSGAYVTFNMADGFPIGNQDIVYGGGGLGTITFIP